MSHTINVAFTLKAVEGAQTRNVTHASGALASSDVIRSWFTLATNSTTVVGDIGKMGTIAPAVDNTGAKLIAIKASSKINIRMNTSTSTGQHGVAAGGFFYVHSTNGTGLRVNNPSTTNTSTIELAVYDL